MVSASAIILAGGQSRRMGTPKAALPFGNSTILERLVAELCKSFDDILILAAPSRSETFPIEHLMRTAPSSVRLLRDGSAYQGAAVALARGLAAAANDLAFACSCDLPLLRSAVAGAMCEMLNGYDAVIPYLGGETQPLCAIYRRKVAAEIEMQLVSGERRLTRITDALKAHRPKEMELRGIDPELHSFMNINTPEDYDLALEILQSLEP
jgi:molybdopterin-guanine dinucleotide biosynthesis protein A